MKELSQLEINRIRKNPGNRSWRCLCFERTLSEDFIREFQNYVYWKYISMKQKLSKLFIAEFKDKIYFQNLLENKNIPREIKDYCRMFL
jgi:hypothetical protein